MASEKFSEGRDFNENINILRCHILITSNYQISGFFIA